MRLIAVLFACLLALGARAETRPLIAPAALAEAAEDYLILDIRGPGPRGYAGGHVPGAVNAPYPYWRGPKENPGQPLSDARLSALLSAIGVSWSRPIAIVHAGRGPGDFGGAARVYWTLKSAGHERLTILEGGLKAWAAAGLPLSRAPTAPRPTTITASLSDRWMAKREEVRAISDGAPGHLIDARPPAFLSGDKKHPAAKKTGTIEGARRVTFTEWFKGDGGILGRFRRPAGAGPIVSFCNTGHWASTNWFYMSEVLGLEDVKLYPESMVGWTLAGEDTVTQ